jgi:hypothetical protein
MLRSLLICQFLLCLRDIISADKDRIPQSSFPGVNCLPPLNGWTISTHREPTRSGIGIRPCSVSAYTFRRMRIVNLYQLTLFSWEQLCMLSVW